MKAASGSIVGENEEISSVGENRREKVIIGVM